MIFVVWWKGNIVFAKRQCLNVLRTVKNTDEEIAGGWQKVSFTQHFIDFNLSSFLDTANAKKYLFFSYYDHCFYYASAGRF